MFWPTSPMSPACAATHNVSLPIGNWKVGRHHAGDTVRMIAERDRLADHIGVTTEVALPECITDERHMRHSGLRVGIG